VGDQAQLSSENHRPRSTPERLTRRQINSLYDKRPIFPS